MSSQCSTSTAPTAQATGSGLPAASTAAINRKNIGKMKLDMPPRPTRTQSKRHRGGGGGGGANAYGGGNAQQQQQGKDDGSVPHVVRVTFLGVAGLLAKPTPRPAPPRDATAAEAGAGDGAGNNAADDGDNAGGDASSRPITATAAEGRSASSDHPFLLFPDPPRLRVVASVSRSRAARGIPSGASRPLASPGGVRPPMAPPPPLAAAAASTSPAGTAGMAAGDSFAGESILVDNQPQSPGRTLAINEISTARNQTGLDGNDAGRRMRTGRGKGIRPSRQHSSGSDASLAMRSRTGSDVGGGGGLPGRDNAPGTIEGIEVIRPYSPTEGKKKRGKKGKVGDWGEEGGVDMDANDGPERLVAVWDEGSLSRPAVKSAVAGGADGGAGAKQKFVNTTNSLAFEAELRPSSSVANNAAGGGGRETPVASTPFAPKSFCVAVGLVPDFDEGEDEASSRILQDLGEGPPSTRGKVDAESASPPPTFAIPVGFADLVINGDETLDGRRKQIDLPLSSLGNFIDLFGGEEQIAQRGGPHPFPLIELTAEGLANSAKNDSNPKESAEDVAAAKAAARAAREAAASQSSADRKAKKRGIVKRMFSRKQNVGGGAGGGAEGGRGSSSSAGGASATTAALGEAAAAASSSPLATQVYDGPTPKSVFELGRQPNGGERALFLERYGVDPSGDAVIRIGLEVFPRGSELEKVFRQKNRLRKKAAAEAARAAASSATAGGGRRRRVRRSPVPSTVGAHSSSSRSVSSRSHFTTDSAAGSLMDDEEDDSDYEGSLDSDFGDSVFSQSFFTMDSDASRTTWDESTMYTDGLSSFNTHDDDSMSYLTLDDDDEGMARGAMGFVKGGIRATAEGNRFLATLLNCNSPALTCGTGRHVVDGYGPKGADDGSRTPKFSHLNIDAVASAMASMSMPDERDNTPKQSGQTPHATGGQGHTPTASIRSASSMATAARAGGRPISPDSIKESGEELSIDAISPTSGEAGASTASAGGGGGAPSPMNADLPFMDRSVTFEMESSPLATIKQRFAESKTFDEGEVRGRQRPGGLKEDEGTEFTLEEHQSSM